MKTNRRFNQLNQKQWLSIGLVGIAFFVVISYLNRLPASSGISYIDDVQPIITSKCYSCHGPDGAKREAGLRLDEEESFYKILESGKAALSSGRLADSELLKRIHSSDVDYQMPPPDFSKPLDAEEIAILSQWVKDGAKWENHWSFEPLQKQEQPKVGNSNWSKHPIDAFIWAEQEAQGLEHAQPSDKRTLIRRLTYDLHGLPPSPEAVANFIEDDSDEAYSKLVDGLLASPRYGERWARHWLDVVHYGETHGYDKDKRRIHAWPYRDYVIDALNKDIPYGRFVEDQIAGDVLHPRDPKSTVALGFLAAGPWDFVGHAELREDTKDKRIVRNLDRDDIVTNSMTSFTSLTVHCARCHDHKFDPIAQEDYYSLQAVFAGIDRANRPFDESPQVHIRRNRLKDEYRKLTKEQSRLSAQMNEEEKAALISFIDEQEEQERKIQQYKTPISKTFGFHSKIESDENHIKWIQLDLGIIQKIDEITLVPAHPTEGIPMPGYGFPLRYKLEIAHASDFSSATTLIDFSHADHRERTDQAYSVEVGRKPARYIRLTAYRLWKGRANDHFLALAEIQVFSKGKNIGRTSRVNVSDQMVDKRWSPSFLTDGFNSRRHISGELLPKHSQDEVKQAQTELLQLKVKENDLRLKVLNETEQQELNQVRDLMDGIKDSISQMPKPSYVYAATAEFDPMMQFRAADSIRPVFILNRGDTEQPTKAVKPGTVNSFETLAHRFDLAEDHREGDRRAALAKWMTHPRNAFTWRSIVNRVWQYHFGKGIVTTPNDFGKMGTPPTHPALLDFLATAFLENGQSLKWLHRLIVTSATYQQQSTSHERNFQIDGENRFLWRFNSRQLEAEAVRDGVLAVSGQLDLTMGGPGFDAFRFEDDHSPRYLYKDYDAFDPSTFRRAIYRFIVRSVPDPFMSTLDCADPSQSVPTRNQTVTALQALSALNNPFMVRQADFFAERLRNENDGIASQLQGAFDLAFQRAPTREEMTELANYSKEHGLSATCRLIFAMNEFLYVD